MQSLFLSITLCGALVFSLSAWAQSGRDLAERVYRDSGMEVQFAQLPEQLAQGIVQSRDRLEKGARLPDNFPLALAAELKVAFNLDAFRMTIIDKLEANLTNAQMNDVLQWLDSAVGRRITALEESSADVSMEQIDAYAQSLSDTAPAAPYLKQIQQLNAQTHAVESTVEITLVMQLGVVFAAIGATPDAPPDALNVAVRQLEAARPQFEQAIGRQVMISLLYTYRDAKPEDLDAYLNFVGSKVGEVYHRVSSQAMTHGLRDVGVNLGHRVPALIKRLLSQRPS